MIAYNTAFYSCTKSLKHFELILFYEKNLTNFYATSHQHLDDGASKRYRKSI